MKKMIEEARQKSKGKEDLKIKDLLTGNLPNKVLRDIHHPDKQNER